MPDNEKYSVYYAGTKFFCLSSIWNDFSDIFPEQLVDGNQMPDKYLVLKCNKHLQGLSANRLIMLYLNLGRRKKYYSFTYFVKDEKAPSGISVRKEPVYSKVYNKPEGVCIRSCEWSFQVGRSLDKHLVELLHYGRGLLEGDFVNRWYRRLLPELSGGKLPGHYVDCIWQNVIVKEDGIYFIDLEWQIDRPISMHYLFFRAMYRFLDTWRGQYLKLPMVYYLYLYSKRFGFHVTLADIVKSVLSEARFVSEVQSRGRIISFLRILFNITMPYQVVSIFSDIIVRVSKEQK